MRTIGLTLALMVFVLLLANIAAVVQKNNGIPNPLEILFPERFVNKEDMQAIETELAPFADRRSDEEVDDLGLGIQYEPHHGMKRVAVDMNLPHLHDGAVNKWVMQAMAEALTFTATDPDKLASHREDLNDFMSANGLKEYDGFLRRIKAIDLMQANNYEMHTFVDGLPNLRTSGAVGGIYRWVYDVPLIMTFLPVGASNYRDMTSNEGDEFITEELSIRVQIGRSKAGREGMIIETWDVLKK